MDCGMESSGMSQLHGPCSVKIQHTALIDGGRAAGILWKARAVRISDDVYAVRINTTDVGFSRFCCGKETNETGRRPLVYKGDLLKTIKDLRDDEMLKAIARNGQQLASATSDGWRKKRKARADQDALLDARSDSLPDTVTVRLPAFDKCDAVDCVVAVPKPGIDDEFEKRTHVFIVPTDASLKYIKEYMYTEFKRDTSARPVGVFTRRPTPEVTKVYKRMKSIDNKCDYKSTLIAAVEKGSPIAEAFRRGSRKDEHGADEIDANGEGVAQDGSDCGAHSDEDCEDADDSTANDDSPPQQELCCHGSSDIHQQDSVSTECPDSLDCIEDMAALGCA